jgi:hypothetical protein
MSYGIFADYFGYSMMYLFSAGMVTAVFLLLRKKIKAADKPAASVL